MTGLVWFLTIFVLAAFVGYEVISKVPSMLHTPLMSGSNAIHGIVLVGALFIMGEAEGTAQLVLGFITVFLATLNVVGGFVVTDRMLDMFRARPERPAAGSSPVASAASAVSPVPAPGSSDPGSSPPAPPAPPATPPRPGDGAS